MAEMKNIDLTDLTDQALYRRVKFAAAEFRVGRDRVAAVAAERVESGEPETAETLDDDLVTIDLMMFHQRVCADVLGEFVRRIDIVAAGYGSWTDAQQHEVKEQWRKCLADLALVESLRQECQWRIDDIKQAEKVEKWDDEWAGILQDSGVDDLAELAATEADIDKG